MDGKLVIVGCSKSSDVLRDFISKVTGEDFNIFISGETGTGKDHLAEIIHQEDRSAFRFVFVDCGVLNENLSGAELFGHTKGAFTGADADKDGLLKMAEEGTIFFNEIANMSLEMQARFLRIIEKKPYRRIGARLDSIINTRIISATNANLEKAIRNGQFRSDLYYRLNLISIVIPPLRERLEDIPPLIEFFLKELKSKKYFSGEAMAIMTGYHWPGNIRELKNCVHRAVFLSGASEEMKSSHIASHLKGVGDNEMPTLSELHRMYCKQLLQKTNGIIQTAASLAGVSTEVMVGMVKEYGLFDYAELAKDN